MKRAVGTSIIVLLLVSLVPSVVGASSIQTKDGVVQFQGATWDGRGQIIWGYIRDFFNGYISLSELVHLIASLNDRFKTITVNLDTIKGGQVEDVPVTLVWDQKALASAGILAHEVTLNDIKTENGEPLRLVSVIGASAYNRLLQTSYYFGSSKVKEQYKLSFPQDGHSKHTYYVTILQRASSTETFKVYASSEDSAKVEVKAEVSSGLKAFGFSSKVSESVSVEHVEKTGVSGEYAVTVHLPLSKYLAEVTYNGIMIHEIVESSHDRFCPWSISNPEINPAPGCGTHKIESKKFSIHVQEPVWGLEDAWIGDQGIFTVPAPEVVS